MGTTHVTVTNWVKFNPRSDRANHSWFRFENSFFTDSAIFTLSADAQRLFIFLCCEASKKGSAEVEFANGLASALLKIPESAIDGLLQELAGTGRIALQDLVASSRRDDGVVTPNDGVTPPNGGITPPEIKVTASLLHTTNVRTNVTNERTDETDGVTEPKATAAAPPKTFLISQDPLVREFLADILPGIEETWVRVWGPDRIWLEGEIKKAAAWWKSNPERRQYGDSVPRFVNSWLQRAKADLAKPKPDVAKSPDPPPTKKALAFEHQFDALGRVIIGPPITPHSATAGAK